MSKWDEKNIKSKVSHILKVHGQSTHAVNVLTELVLHINNKTTMQTFLSYVTLSKGSFCSDRYKLIVASDLQDADRLLRAWYEKEEFSGWHLEDFRIEPAISQDLVFQSGIAIKEKK